MTGRRSAAVLAGAASAVFAIVSLALMRDAEGGFTVEGVFDVLTTVSFGLAGAALAWARPRNPIGWLLLVVGLCEGLADVGSSLAVHSSIGPGAVQTGAAWLASWVWFPALSLLPTAVLALYPSGHAGSRFRRLLVATGLAGTAAVMAGFALVDDAVQDIAPGAANPWAVQPLGIGLAVLGAVLLVPTVLLTLIDAGRRLWRASSPEREQLGWLLVTVVLTLLISYTPWHTIRAAAYLLVPIAIVVGVVRHRLLDLQVVVRRALLFIALTALVVAVFVVSTTVLSGIADGDGFPVAVSAALVAILLTPARDRLQRGVDRLVYGDRRDPVRAVAGLGRDVARHDDDDALVPQVLAAVRDAVRSPHVALLTPEGAAVAEAGAVANGTPLRLELRVSGRGVGVLLVAPRTPREGWSRADRELLDLLTAQVALVVHATQLYDDLAESRDRVLGATAEERQRLRAELHDGLGPALSGIALGLEAAEVSLAADPLRAGSLVARLRQETQAASGEVRRLVDGLRPAALEGRDLATAVRAFLDGLRDLGRLEIELEIPGPLPDLAADLDAAAYRIVAEAVTNVVRHSGARRCRVRLEEAGGELLVLVEDDGHGLPAQPRAGIGLTSMRARAAELGGTWTARPRDGGGTAIEVGLPLVGPAVPA
jgi:signal transduction histidine kinase